MDVGSKIKNGSHVTMPISGTVCPR